MSVDVSSDELDDPEVGTGCGDLYSNLSPEACRTFLGAGAREDLLGLGVAGFLKWWSAESCISFEISDSEGEE